jgi:thiamine-monophosphate kinase
VGEFDLIARLAAALGPAGTGVTTGIGDDAAVLAPDLVVSTDLTVENVHFRRATTGLADLGWKALAVAVSDLAAMGAEPLGAVIGLALGPGWTPDDVVAIYGGVAECALACDCPVVGGDVSRAAALVLAVTVFGRAAAPVTRAGARPGDVLAVTGTLGGSEAGRLLLEGDAPDSPELAALSQRHRRPVPRLADGRALAATVHAMLDVSDGVASDARRLAESSDVRVQVDLDALPLQAGVAGVAAAVGIEPGVFAARGGEDYELLVALSVEALRASPVPLTPIGRILDGPAGVEFTGAGADPALAGFDHLGG